MRYDDLNDGNKIGEKEIPDGYTGKTAKVSIHMVDGTPWYKAACGCFRAPESEARK